MSVVGKLTSLLLGVLLAIVSGCAARTPMASQVQDAASKTFAAPPAGMAGVYIYRNSNFGGGILKRISIDGKVIGSIAPYTYFHNELTPGQHTIATQAEFGDNELKLDAEGGRNYFVHQYIKFGTFVGSANVELVSEEEGKEGVLECKEAAQGESPK